MTVTTSVGWRYKIDATFPTDPLHFAADVRRSGPGESGIRVDALSTKTFVRSTKLDTTGRPQPDFPPSAITAHFFIPAEWSPGQGEILLDCGLYDQYSIGNGFPWPADEPRTGALCTDPTGDVNGYALPEAEVGPLVATLNAGVPARIYVLIIRDDSRQLCTLVLHQDGTKTLAFANGKDPAACTI